MAVLRPKRMLANAAEQSPTTEPFVEAEQQRPFRAADFLLLVSRRYDRFPNLAKCETPFYVLYKSV